MCNVIVVVLELLFLIGLGPYVAFVHDMPIFTFLAGFLLIFLIANVIWYFDQQGRVTREVLGYLSIAGLVEFVVGIVLVVIFLNGTMQEQIEVLLVAALLLLPTFILSISVLIMLRETEVQKLLANFSSQGLIQGCDQEAPQMMKAPMIQQVQYVPVVISGGMTSQFAKIQS